MHPAPSVFESTEFRPGRFHSPPEALRLDSRPRPPYYCLMKACIEFEDLSFFYLYQDAPSDISEIQEQDINFIFRHLDMKIPQGVTSLIGENGVGKSTLLLLAGARLFPPRGRVRIMGADSAPFREVRQDPDLEEERNRLVSFVYQNMEFDTEDALGDLLAQVIQAGRQEGASEAGLEELVKALELQDELARPSHALAKGPMQRALIAMALLYGSKVILMDEPVFALEDDRKARVMGFVRDYAHARGSSVIFSAHDLELSREYSDHMIILKKAPNPGEPAYFLGPTKEICTREHIEEAYRVPFDTLHRKEHLYREMLQKRSRQANSQN